MVQMAAKVTERLRPSAHKNHWSGSLSWVGGKFEDGPKDVEGQGSGPVGQVSMGAINTCEEADMRKVGEFGKLESPIFRGARKFQEDRMEVDAFGLDEWDE